MAQNYVGGGNHTEKFVLEVGNTAYTFLMSGTNGVGTPHNIERKHTRKGGHRSTYFVGVGTPHNIYRKSLAVGGWVVQARE